MKEKIDDYKGFDLTVYRENLKKLRLKMNKTQKEMSEMINMSEEAWGKNERGECVPSTEFLLKLNVSTGVDIGTLFFRGKGSRERIIEMLNDMSDTDRSILLLEITKLLGVEESIELIGKLK
ncbi:MAG: helix-turn-helix transcriptional regulator [Lachnospiraceae bacterium]|nr:helix-turn-helix transcriptional regulator [Lachnospiraceae bacterium]